MCREEEVDHDVVDDVITAAGSMNAIDDVVAFVLAIEVGTNASLKLGRSASTKTIIIAISTDIIMTLPMIDDFILEAMRS
jgi:hypothetical protein